MKSSLLLHLSPMYGSSPPPGVSPDSESAPSEVLGDSSGFSSRFNSLSFRRAICSANPSLIANDWNWKGKIISGISLLKHNNLNELHRQSENTFCHLGCNNNFFFGWLWPVLREKKMAASGSHKQKLTQDSWSGDKVPSVRHVHRISLNCNP